MFCYNSFINASNFKTQTRKTLISYYKINGINFFNKHVNANHAIVAKKFEAKINSSLRKIIKKRPTRKRPNLFGKQISILFCYQKSFEK